MAQAATTSTEPSLPVYDVRIANSDINYTPIHPTIGKAVRIYVTIENKGTEDVEGLVRFFDGEAFIGGKLFSLRSGNRPEDAWIVWNPSVTGTHVIRVEAVNDTAYPDEMPSDNKASVTILIEPDADRDGIPDADDPDADNDGLTNLQEAAKKTDPLKVDTDGDNVSDKTDAFPLDPKRTIAPPPAPKPKPLPTPAPKPTIKPATTTSAAVATTSTPAIVLENSTDTLVTTSSTVLEDSTNTEPLVPTETITPPSTADTGTENTVIHILIGLGVLCTLIGAGALFGESASRKRSS